MKPAWSHVGICVSDIERSKRFYCEVFGFVATDFYDVGNDYRGLMEMSPDVNVRLLSQFLQLGDGATRIELLYFESPPADGPRTRRRMNQYGMTHINFRVDDVDALATKLRAFGGEVHDHTRTKLASGTDVVYCSDPDGVRIEVYSTGQRG